MTGDLSRVRETVMATACIGRIADEIFCAAGPDDILHELVTHIGRIVLTRRIVVTFTDGTALTCDVRHRRILCVKLPSHSAASSECGDANDSIMFVPDTVEATVADLRASLSGRTIQTLRVIDDPNAIYPTSHGLPASVLLSGTVGKETHGKLRSLEGTLDDLVAEHADAIMAACVTTHDDILAIAGCDDLIISTCDWATNAFDLQAEGKMRRRPLGDESVAAVNFPGATPRILLVTRSDDKTGLVLINNHDPKDGLTRWMTELQARRKMRA